jgi:hypothetical protein
MPVYSHVRDGRVVNATIVEYDCPTKLVIYKPIDTSIQRAIVILTAPHSHPVHPRHKPTYDAKAQYEELTKHARLLGATADKVASGTLHTSAVHFIILIIF